MLWGVYIKRSLDGHVFDSFTPDVPTSEVQAMRFNAHLLSGDLLEFDAIEQPMVKQ